MSIAVIFGGPSPEHDVSVLTGLQSVRELVRQGRSVISIFWSKTGDWYKVSNDLEGAAFLQGLPSGSEPLQLIASADGGFVAGKKGLLGKASALDIDVAVNCCHGGPGEDGSLQGALDLCGVPYTGPSALGAALGMDKLAFAGLVAAAGLPTLPRHLLTADTAGPSFPGPYIVKPRFGGSSIGIEVVDTIDTARALLRSSPHLRSGAIVESYLPDSFDLNVAVRMFPTPQLSAIEKPVRTNTGGQILGYADKYVGGQGMVSAPREIPAVLDDDVREALHHLALQTAQLCGVRGVQRIDFLMNGDDLYVNEINTIPGSLAKHLWVEPAVPFATLLSDMIAEATASPTRQWSTSGADGSALRSAGSIAGKLS